MASPPEEVTLGGNEAGDTPGEQAEGQQQRMRKRKKRKGKESAEAAAVRAQRAAEANGRHLCYLPLLEAALASHGARGGSCLYAPSDASAAELLVSVGGGEPAGTSTSDSSKSGTVVSSADFAEAVRAHRDGGPSAAPPPRIRVTFPAPTQCPSVAQPGAPSAVQNGGSDAADASELDAPLVGRVHENAGPLPATAHALDEAFVVPPRSAFAFSDAAMLPKLARELGTFDLIVLDPPWENASARRSSAYRTLTPRQIARLPVRRLCRPGALVALWLTNRERLRRCMEEELLPAWGLEPVAEWLWLKVDAAGRPAVPLNGGGGGDGACGGGAAGDGEGGSGSGSDDGDGGEGSRAAPQPPEAASEAKQRASSASCPRRAYEPLLLARFVGGGAREVAADGGDSPSEQWWRQLPARAVLVAPVMEHSRKPRLGAFLEGAARPRPEGASADGRVAITNSNGGAPPPARRLELFARELEEGWAAWGNEVLRYQGVRAPS